MPAAEPTWRTFTDPDVIADNITQVSAVLERFALWPSPDVQQAIEARLRILTDAAIVIHCTRPEGLLGITTQGRFISSLQRGGGDPDYVMVRQRVESALFGERTGHPEIVYGALTAPEYRSAASTYGGIRLTLRPELRARCTITRTDSLILCREGRYSPEWSLLAAVPLETPSAILVPRKSVAELERATCLNDLHAPTDYFEVQVHGGVAAQDIASVELRSGTILAREVTRWLNQNQIPLRMQ